MSAATAPAINAPATTTAEANVLVRRLGHQPALDGLRALAILSVFLLHAEFPLAKGGFLGVDIFFVMSGFLITSLLLQEFTDTHTIRLGAFFARRARRLLPAFLLFAVALMVIVYPVVNHGQQKSLVSGMLASVFYVRNWALIYTSSGQDGFTQPHLWSLAVEEQFYLIWPVVFLILIRKFGTKRILQPLVALFTASLVLCVALRLTGSSNARIYLATDVRAAQLIAGAIFAVLFLRGWTPQRWPQAFRVPTLIRRVPKEIWPFLAIGVVMASVELWNSGFNAIYLGGGMAIFGLLVGVFIILLLRSESSVLARILATPPLRFIGKISYSFYLWHALVITLFAPASVVHRSWFHIQNKYVVWLESPSLRLPLHPPAHLRSKSGANVTL
jgi:peptidoglycan/LPS O-acetylase OafA/YrhL